MSLFVGGPLDGMEIETTLMVVPAIEEADGFFREVLYVRARSGLYVLTEAVTVDSMPTDGQRIRAWCRREWHDLRRVLRAGRPH